MAADAAFAQRFMLKNKRASLCGMTLETSLVFAEQGDAAPFERLWETCAPAFNRTALMRIMAIDTTHLSFQYRVMMRQFEFCPHFEVTLKTGFRVAERIHDRVRTAATLDV